MRAVWLLVAMASASCAADSPCKGNTHLLKRCIGNPAYVAFRDGSGPWETPKPDANGMADLCVTDDYEFIEVSGSGPQFFANEFASTWSESTPDTTCSSGTATPVAVTGQMAQHGLACIGGECVGMWTSLPWTFNLRTEPGVHDFVASTEGAFATTGGGKVLIRRGQSITSPKEEALVDLDAEGTPFDSTGLQIQGALSGESVTETVNLWTSHGDIAQVSMRQDGFADVVPSALLEKNDQQWLEVDGSLHGGGVFFTGTEASFTLLPPLTGMTVSAAPVPTASWTSIAVNGYTDVLLSVQLDMGTSCLGCGVEWVDATKGWLDAHALNSLVFDTTAPGFDSRWVIDSSQSFSANASVAVSSPASSMWTATAPIQNGTLRLSSPLTPPAVRALRQSMTRGTR